MLWRLFSYYDRLVNEAIFARSGSAQPFQRLPLSSRRGGAAERIRSHRPAPILPAADADLIEALDRSACLLANREARCRLVQARVVAALLKRRQWRPLGFSRLSSYAPERLGISARSLEEDARVITALDALPGIRQALETGSIRWTHARLLAGIATTQTERDWLQLALSSTTRQLAQLVNNARAGNFSIQ